MNAIISLSLAKLKAKSCKDLAMWLVLGMRLRGTWEIAGTSLGPVLKRLLLHVPVECFWGGITQLR